MAKRSPSVLIGLFVLAALSGCQAARQGLVSRIDAALGAAADFLASRQSDDGAWRSKIYGAMRDGPSLTPHVCASLMFLGRDQNDAAASFARGRQYLIDFVALDGSTREEPPHLIYPVYTSAMAAWVVACGADSAAARQSRAAWLACVEQHRLSEALGWTPSDPSFGGWGYSVRVPTKGVDGGGEANLSATVFGLGGLRLAGEKSDDPAFQEILAFVTRCQNYAEDPATSDPAFDDGGFFFSPVDAARNKAGSAGIDRHGRTRFHSYGSMTCDGLRGLLRCGLPPTHPRVIAARHWLEQHFSVSENPGNFAADRAVLRDATYYYYCWSLAHALMALNMRTLATTNGAVDWADALAEELVRRQRPDGSWVNRFTDTKEDDPLVATPFAVAALTICRQIIASQGSGQ